MLKTLSTVAALAAALSFAVLIPSADARGGGVRGGGFSGGHGGGHIGGHLAGRGGYGGWRGGRGWRGGGWYGYGWGPGIYLGDDYYDDYGYDYCYWRHGRRFCRY